MNNKLPSLLADTTRKKNDMIGSESSPRRIKARRISSHRMLESTLPLSPTPGDPPPTLPLLRPSPFPRLLSGCPYPPPTSHNASRLAHQPKDMDEEVKPTGRKHIDDDNKVVRFQTRVEMIVIPSHIHYTQEVRETIWYDKKERLRMVNRNTIEFKYDNEKWENCLEEEDMIEYKGRLYHPITHAILMLRIARRREEQQQQQQQQRHHHQQQQQQRKGDSKKSGLKNFPSSWTHHCTIPS